MGKVSVHVHRKDSILEHTHILPDGEKTGGMLMKPNGLHSHLFKDIDTVLETAVADGSRDHIHETSEGLSSGPQTMASKSDEPKSNHSSADQSGIVGGVEKNDR